MASHHQPPALRIISGLDEALKHGRGEIEARTHRVGVRPIDPERIRRIFGQPLDYPEPVRFTPSRNQPPSFGEKLVAFARRWQFRFGIGCYMLAVGTACYFAFQMGRGL